MRRACRTAERSFEGLAGRSAVEEALATLCEPFDGSLLASLYVVEHDRLWLVAQHGYADVRDGFDLDHGVMGRAIRTRTIQLVAEVTAGATPGTETAEVAIPFQAGTDVVGVLTVESIGVALPRSAGALLAPLASLFGERLSESREGVESSVEDLVRLCVHASSLRGVGAIAELATRTTGRILGLSSTQLDLWREEDIQPRLVSFWRRHDAHLEPLDGELLVRLERAAGEHVTASVVAAQQVGVREESTTSLVVLPLRAGGSPVGLLTGRLAGPPPSKERLEAATLFAQHTAALIDVATALRREQRAAVTDQLTGLLNRRGFEERFEEELRRGAHDELPVSVVLCDCDGLKTMNDLRGHETGDALIELIASCLRTHKRTSDVAARIGGDEFAILLPDADIETALAVAERIRGAIAAETLAGFRPSASFGVATFPLHGTSTTQIMKRADEALYLAKQRGGDEIAAFAALKRHTVAPFASRWARIRASTAALNYRHVVGWALQSAADCPRLARFGDGGIRLALGGEPVVGQSMEEERACRSKRRALRSSVCFIALLALVAAGCGGSDGGGAPEALPSSSCTAIEYEGDGDPDYLIVSDLPLQGASRTQTVQINDAIRYELKQANFKAGDYNIGFQACDDATAQAGKWDSGKCSQNANAYAANDKVIGIIGTFNSGCAGDHHPGRQPGAGRRHRDDLAGEHVRLPDAGGPRAATRPSRTSTTRRARATTRASSPTTPTRVPRTPSSRRRRASRSVYILNDKEAYGLGVATNFRERGRVARHQDRRLRRLGPEGVVATRRCSRRSRQPEPTRCSSAA